MADPVLYGADYSVYVRIARMALAEKGVAYRLEPVDVFAADGIPPWYIEMHPFGRIPAFAHDGLTLYETAAIVRYVDEAFPGPSLQPADPKARAVLAQIVGMLDAYAYRPLVWDIAVEMVDKPKEGLATDTVVVQRAMPLAETALSELARLKRDGDWLLGDALSLADIHAAPIIGYFLKAPIAMEMLERHPVLIAWWHRISARPSWVASEPASPPNDI